MGQDANTIDRLIARAADGSISRRELVKRAGALGLSAPLIAGLVSLSSREGTSAQAGEVTLSFDAGSTGGGGGKPTEDLLAYCRLIDGGSQFELDRMVDIRLVTLSADLQSYVGELAESWDVTGNTITFKLRPNAKWHDGQPLTAKDVVFTINLLVNPASKSRWGVSFQSVVGYKEVIDGTATEVTGVKAPDDLTLTLELTQPDSGLLPGFMFISIIPQHVFADVDLSKVCEAPNWTKARIGAGPFKFVNLLPNERIELAAFDDYVLGRPKIDKLNLLFFQSFETSLAAFQQQTSLIAPMTVLNLDLVESFDFAEIMTTPAGVGAIWINTQHADWSDKRVRQAMSYAVDRKTITDNLFRGYADPVSTEIPYLAWTQAPDLNPYDYDPEKAKALLQEAGWKGDATYTLWYYYPDQLTASVMEAIQQYLGAVGIKVELRFDDGSGARQKEMDEGAPSLTYGSFGAQPAPANLSIIWGCQAQATWSYCNADFDAAMEAGLRTYDQEEQAKHYQTAIKIINEELPWVWLFDRKNLLAVNKKLNTNGNAFGPGHILFANHAHDWTVTE
ncbi:MAG: peptide/nickel transport system substrate-binding protein [Thermomicrobiales bacterium]|jgi:peptide/nickel transport system substrate-binding protein|nr:peptide/nickel transport system substrate-binding protein [Thermomicrobiales bacterium]